MEGITFPATFKDIVEDEETKPANVSLQKQQLEEQKLQRELQEKENEMMERNLKMAGMSKREEDKDRKMKRKDDKRNRKLGVEWEKLGIYKFFKSMLGKLGLVAVGIATLGSGFLSGILNDFMELMLYAAVDPNGSLIAMFIKSIVPLFLNLANLIINILFQLIPDLIQFFVKMTPVFLKTLEKVIYKIIEAIPMIIDMLMVAVPIIFNAFVKATPRIVHAIMEGVSKILNQIATRIPALKPLAEFITELAKGVDYLFSGEGTFLERLKVFLTNIFSSMLSFIKNSLSSLWEYGKTWFKDFYNGLSDLGKILIWTIGIIGALVLGFLILKGVLIAMAALPAIVSAAMMAVSAIIAFFPFLVIGFLVVAAIAAIAALIVYWDDIWNFITSSWNKFVGYLKNGWNWLTNAFSSIVDFLTETITSPFNLIKVIWKNWDKVSRKLRDGFMSLINLFGRLGEFIKQKIDSFFNMIKNFNLGEFIKNTLSNALEDIPGLNKIKEFFEFIANWLKDKLKWFGINIGDNKDSGQQYKTNDVIASQIDMNIEKLFGGKQVDDRIAEYVKSSGEANRVITIEGLREIGFEANQELIDALEKMRISYQASIQNGKVDQKGLEDRLDKLIKETKNKPIPYSLKPSRTFFGG